MYHSSRCIILLDCQLQGGSKLKYVFWSLGVRPYKCNFCLDDFIDNRALKKHTIKVHGEETKGGISKDLGLEIIRTAHRKKTAN